MTAADLTQHLHELADKLDVSLRWSLETPFLSEYNDAWRFARLAPVQDYGPMYAPDGSTRLNFTELTTYYVGLHELGHAAIGVAPSADQREVLDEEGGAWLWALEHGSVEPDDATLAFVRAALKRYGDHRPHAAPFASVWAEALQAVTPAKEEHP